MCDFSHHETELWLLGRSPIEVAVCSTIMGGVAVCSTIMGGVAVCSTIMGGVAVCPTIMGGWTALSQCPSLDLGRWQASGEEEERLP